MIRRSIFRYIGADGAIFLSAVTDKRYLDHRLALLGKDHGEGVRPAPLTDEQLKRFTTSISNPEFLFNKESGLVPSGVVDDDGREKGSAALDPTRFGDWEVNGRCCDF